MTKTAVRLGGLLLWVGIVAGTSGCAVLEIDVDVYKGPLSNREEVQYEQVAVMAVGAKPLLVQLRDELEAQAREITVEELRTPSLYSRDGGGLRNTRVAMPRGLRRS